MSARISAEIRATVRERAEGCCEYCRVHEDDVLVPHEPDHVIAEQHDGRSTLENLALARFHCNRFKGPNISSIDPDSGEIVPLFNPRTQLWQQHFRFDGANIVPISANGRTTVSLLKLNSSERIRVRRSLMSAERFPLNKELK